MIGYIFPAQWKCSLHSASGIAEANPVVRLEVARGQLFVCPSLTQQEKRSGFGRHGHGERTAELENELQLLTKQKGRLRAQMQAADCQVRERDQGRRAGFSAQNTQVPTAGRPKNRQRQQTRMRPGHGMAYATAWCVMRAAVDEIRTRREGDRTKRFPLGPVSGIPARSLGEAVRGSKARPRALRRSEARAGQHMDRRERRGTAPPPAAEERFS